MKILSTIFTVLLLVACSSQESNEATTAITKPLQTEPSSTPSPQEATKTSQPTQSQSSTSLFTLKTLAGEEIHIDETPKGLSFKEYKDKVVLVLFFGHRCPPCLAEIPVLKALVNQGHKDLEIVAVEVQGQSEEQLKAFQKRMGINYHLVTGKDHYPFISYISEKANWTGSIPFLLGFDKQSEVKVVHVGGVNAQQFDNIYETLKANQ